MTSASPMRIHAARFGAELTRAMAEREVGQHVVKDAAGVSRASIVEFRHGRNLPTTVIARRLAEALTWPRLLAIVEQARTRTCEVCARTFIQDTGRPRRYCSIACRNQGNVGGNAAAPAEAVEILRGEMLRVGPIRKQSVGKALTLLDDVVAPAKAAQAALELHRDAVAGMCASCEPEGYCNTPSCELRPVSPCRWPASPSST